MTDEDQEVIKKLLFKAKAAELPGVVSSLCVLAANLEDYQSGFGIAHKVLRFCLQELEEYEARTMRQRDDFEDIDAILAKVAAGKKGEDDGN